MATTTKKQLVELRLAKQAASKAYNEYLAQYNKEHGTGRTQIKEIIDLHKQGFSNKEIVEKGYNKHTVQGQVSLFKKGTKTQSTVVAKYIGTEEEEGGEDE